MKQHDMDELLKQHRFTTIGVVEGIDLLARVVEGEGFYGHLKNVKLPEIGPYKDLTQLENTLSGIAVLYKKLEESVTETISSDEYAQMTRRDAHGNRVPW
jgi:hypothetical protein